MFFFQIECKKNTKSFVLQMLAAHNVAIILNIWDAWIITKILRNTEVKAFLYSFTKKKKKKRFVTVASEMVCQVSTSDW